MKNLKVGDLIQYTGDPDELKEFDDHIVNGLMIEAIDKLTDEGKVVDQQQVEQERQRAMAKLKKFGVQRFIKLEEVLDPLDYGVEVKITNEKVDAGVTVSNLISVLKIAPDQAKTIIPSIFDILGISYNANTNPPNPQNIQNGPQPQQQVAQSPAQPITQANAIPS